MEENNLLEYLKMITFAEGLDEVPVLLLLSIILFTLIKSLTLIIMGTTTLDLIKDSFETWYNTNIAKDSPVSIVINYNDIQVLPIKAYHTITMDMRAIGIKNNLAYTTSLVKIQENYNHGITSEEEAKDGLIMKLLEHLYGFKA